MVLNGAHARAWHSVQVRLGPFRYRRKRERSRFGVLAGAGAEAGGATPGDAAEAAA